MNAGEGTYLAEILAAKRSELAAARQTAGVVTARELEEVLQRVPAPRSLIKALRGTPAPRFIAEFKRASPSQGTIREAAVVGDVLPGYQRAGAAAVSVLTDRHFDGSLADLAAARGCVDVPVLRKDFILERSQILEARKSGADAVLLIVAALPPPKLKQLLSFTHELGMEALCEAHDEHELDRAMSAGAKLVGVNARDLRTFEVNLQRCIDLRRLVPPSFTYVAESGIKSAEDIARLRDASVDAVLVGTTLMAAEDPEQALRELVGEPSVG